MTLDFFHFQGILLVLGSTEASTTTMNKGTLEQTSWNFTQGEGVLFGDHNLFFGPVTRGEQSILLQPDQDMIDVLVMVGIFPSKTIARKNGWAADQEPTFRWQERGGMMVVAIPGRRVPKGFTFFRAGKGKATEIAILNIQ